MILKIKSEVENAVQSWRFFEDVQGLHFTVYNDADSFRKEWNNSPKIEGAQEIWYDYHLRPVAINRPLLFLAFYSESTGNTHVFCETECYLLNDNGKTIEKLI